MTYILSAIEATNSDSTLAPNPVLVRKETDLYLARNGPQDASSNQVNPDALKFLNQVALLLVREHEIVAVLPTRSGSQAHGNVTVTVDSNSDSDPDENSTKEDSMHQANIEKTVPLGNNYLVTRNPRNDSPPGRKSNSDTMTVKVLRGLAKVTTIEDMYKYLIKYRYVPFTIAPGVLQFLSVSCPFSQHPRNRSVLVSLPFSSGLPTSQATQGYIWNKLRPQRQVALL